MLVSRPPRVVVVGSYAVGLVMRTRQFPMSGETVLGRNFETMDGGKGSNQAVACARLGAYTTLIACVGDDSYGAHGLHTLIGEQVDVTYIRRHLEVGTGAGFIIVDEQGQNSIVVDLGANQMLAPVDIDRAEGVIADAEVLLAQLEIPVETALYALGVARRHGVTTVLNPAPASRLELVQLAGIDVLTPNESEAATLVPEHAGDLYAMARALRQASGGAVVLTLGERGALICDSQGEEVIAATAVTAVDTTGAGDAFAAALTVKLAEKAPLRDAVIFAAAAGAYCVQSAGTVPSYATREELDTFIARAQPSSGS